jgi:tetraprenyl-beta-curcumene synthase
MSSLNGQSATLVRCAGRELVWGLRRTTQELRGWHARAMAIPDPRLRQDALTALERKRGNIQGAALFWTLPERRNRDLLRTLIVYEVLADYLDCVSERGALLGVRNGRQLHLALVEALDPERGISDYYRYHDSCADGGYACALVQSCREGMRRLPSYEPVRPFLARAASMSSVLALNHEPNPTRREQALRQWAARQWPSETSDAAYAPGAGQSWFERTGGASAWLTVLALLSLAASPMWGTRAQEEVAQTYSAYLDWIAPLGAMLDSFSDLAEDAARGEHSYIAHYPSMDVARERVSELVLRSRGEALALPGGARHTVLLACMIAFYLSKDSMRTPELRASAYHLSRAGGPLVTLLLPVLRLWRIAYRQRSA